MDCKQSLRWTRERRITRHEEYSECYAHGEKHFTKYFVIFFFENRHTIGRVGLAVTKKNGNAVARNRIKRVLRSFFRLYQNEIPCMDIVVAPKKHLRVHEFNLAVAEHELLPFLRKLSVEKH